MANQQTISKGSRSIVRVVLLGLALLLLCGKLDGPATQVINLFCAATRETLVLLPSFVLTAWQALQPEDHQQVSLCAFEMLVFWPLLQSVAKVA
jgi:fumarate reductase subunit D